jgi:hypothetical protein
MKPIKYPCTSTTIIKNRRPGLSTTATERRAAAVNGLPATRCKWLAARLGGILFAAVLVLLPSSAQAQCAQWDVSGQWSLNQGKDTTVHLQIEQDGSGVRGKADYYVNSSGGGVRTILGSLDGFAKGHKFRIQIYWSGTSVGIYEGNIGPQGRIEGTTYDRQKPSVRATWFSNKAMKCARR